MMFERNRKLSAGATLLIFILAGGVCDANLIAQTEWTRQEVANALANAEARRLAISIRIVQQYNYDIEGTPAGEFVLETFRLSDSRGRYRFEQTNDLQTRDGRTIPSKSLFVWNNREGRSRQLNPDEPNAPNIMGITDEVPVYHMYDDDIWPLLGIFVDFPITERTPRTRISDAVRDTKAPVRISEITQEDRKLVRVELLDPWHANEEGAECIPEYIYTFDPQRDWLMVESIQNNAARQTERYATSDSEQIRITRAEQFGDVWIPRTARVERISRTREEDWVSPGDSESGVNPIVQKGDDGVVREFYRSTIRVTDVNVNPEITDEDFTIDVADLPEGSSIVDSRLGISYKLGSDLIYMDGRLNRAGREITDEITPDELKELMADAEPLIDPELAKVEENLQPVVSKGVWTNRTAYGLGMIGIGIGVLGLYLFWRKQHATA